jgi:hypothetical protein
LEDRRLRPVLEGASGRLSPMPSHPSVTTRLFRSFGFFLTVTFALGACGEGQRTEDDTDNVGGGGASGGQSSAGGQNTGGQPANGGQNNTGGESATGGAMVSSGGTSSGGSGGAMPSSGGTDSGGTLGSGGADSSAGGTDGSGGAPSDECTRALLDGLLDDYFVALSAGDPSSLPLAADLKFTENAQETDIGTTEFWMNAGDTKYSQRLLDTEACSAAAQAVIPEDGMDLPVGLRIKVVASEITEIETVVVRPGDYTASFAVPSNPDAIIAISDDIGWHEEVPEPERATREELISWIENYFRAFPNGVCDTTSACIRLENGGGNFSCGNSCSGGSGSFEPRVVIADVERGIAAGFTIFDFMTVGHLDMHMMKMSGGQVHAVHAILRDTNGQSGWE